MTYRDNLEAARVHREELVKELAEVRGRLIDRDALADRERQLVEALAEASARVDHLRSRASLPLLRHINVASPCPENWDAMIGDGRARHCGRCEKKVYDLSAMSAVEAETLLAARGELCVRFYRRADGTVMTSDCPDGARRRRRRRVVVAVAVASLAATGMTLQFVTRDAPAPKVEKEVRLMGLMVPEPAQQQQQQQAPHWTTSYEQGLPDSLTYDERDERPDPDDPLSRADAPKKHRKAKAK